MLDREPAELLGGHLLAARRDMDHKTSPAQLAEAVRTLEGPSSKCSTKTILQYEQGFDGRVVRSPSLPRLGVLAKAMGTTASALLDGVL